MLFKKNWWYLFNELLFNIIYYYLHFIYTILTRPISLYHLWYPENSLKYKNYFLYIYTFNKKLENQNSKFFSYKNSFYKLPNISQKYTEMRYNAGRGRENTIFAKNKHNRIHFGFIRYTQTHSYMHENIRRDSMKCELPLFADGAFDKSHFWPTSRRQETHYVHPYTTVITEMKPRMKAPEIYSVLPGEK